MRSIDALKDFYTNDENNLFKRINEIYDRIEEDGLKPVWISINSRAQSLARVQELLQTKKEDRKKSALWGIPYAVKDNIDVKGFLTTAGCPTYSKELAKENAFVVEKLEAAGGILIGKCNMDQFATGLVGTRTPSGICSSIFNEEYISGGSSSGSAVCVGKGYVSFALGTDTAGSGRVPAMCNNLIGYKPTRGLISTRGVLPACRSLDCVSIFSETIKDAQLIFSVLCEYDCEDCYSRRYEIRSCPWLSTAHFRFGIPNEKSLKFFDDQINEKLYFQSIRVIEEKLGGEAVPFDYQIFLQVAQLLYQGPWVNERYVSVGAFVDEHPSEVDPIVYSIVSKSKNYSAEQLFTALYQLEAYKKQVHELWSQFDLLILPTAATIYKIDQIRQAPMELNSNLGYYTNFVNLLDLCGIAIPTAIREDGLPFGITLISQAMTDNALFLLGDRIHRLLSTYLANSTCLLSSTPTLSSLETGNCLIGVLGAHLTGQPLNYQLTERNGRFVRKTLTREDYRLFLLKESEPLKPGLLHQRNFEGPGIEIEIWSLPNNEIGSFIQLIPPPLTIGSIYLQDASLVKGFLVESSAIANAPEITALGGWRNYLQRKTSPA